MADLNEQIEVVTRKKWDRSNKVRIINDHGKTPRIIFEIETITTDNDVMTGSTPKSILEVEFDPTESYPLISPLDDSVMSPDGGNHSMIHVQLYSLFKHLVKW